MPKAILVNDLSQYIDILSLKEGGEVAYIHDDNAKTFKYGMFEGDANPTELKAWSVYDLFYFDVPATYEAALSMIAKKEFKSAKELLQHCGAEKTKNKEVFSTTSIYKNYVPHKLFLCALGEKDYQEAIKLYKEIDRNEGAHARVSVLKDILPILVEEKQGDLALKVAEELIKLRFAKRDQIEIYFSKALGLSLLKKYAEAREVINELIATYEKDNPDLKSRAIETQARIFIDHQKNYKEGVQFLEKVRESQEVYFSHNLYEKMGDGLFGLGKLQEARWNYLNAFLRIESDKDLTESIISKVQAINVKLGEKGGNQGLESLFDKVKSSL